MGSPSRAPSCPVQPSALPVAAPRRVIVPVVRSSVALYAVGVALVLVGMSLFAVTLLLVYHLARRPDGYQPVGVDAQPELAGLCIFVLAVACIAAGVLAFRAGLRRSRVARPGVLQRR